MKQPRNLLLLCMFMLAGGVAWAGPKLVVDQNEYNFGTVAQGDKVRHGFTFTNTGDMPLLVEKVRSSCGCTAVLVSAKNLEPGASGELMTLFDSTRFRGEVAKTVYLYTNDPLAPVTQLVVKGEVLELFTLLPRQVQFGPVKPGETVEKRVTLTNLTGADVTFSPVRVTTPELRAKMPRQLLTGESTEVHVFLKLKPGQTRFSGYVMLETEGDKPHALSLPVYATANQ